MHRSVHYTFDDPNPYQRAIQAAEIEISIVEKGAFHAELTQVNFDKLWMQVGHENLARIFHSVVNPRRSAFTFLVNSDQEAIIHSGMNLTPKDIAVVGRDTAHYHRTWGGTHWGAVSLTPADLASNSYSLIGRELTVPNVTYVATPNRNHFSRLLGLHKVAERLAQNSPEVLANKEVARALEQSLIHAIISCLIENEPSRMTVGGRRHLGIMKRFEQLLAENSYKPLYLAEICTATGASERVLRACCQEHLGIGPIQYLWLRRMHLARQALKLATPHTATVTQIATDHGFWELGRFANKYQLLFGEPPSVTLRRT